MAAKLVYVRSTNTNSVLSAGQEALVEMSPLVESLLDSGWLTELVQKPAEPKVSAEPKAA